MAELVVAMAEPLESASDRDAASYRDASMRLLEMFLDKAKRLAEERISLGRRIDRTSSNPIHAEALIMADEETVSSLRLASLSPSEVL
jgi:hypothetical protein